MTQWSGPFVDNNTFSEVEWEKLFGGLHPFRVLARYGDPDLQVSVPAAAANPGRLSVAPGSAIVRGFLYSTDQAVPVDIPTNPSVDPRMVAVVLRLSRSSGGSGTVAVGYVAAAAGASPVDPVPVDDGTTTEVILAVVRQPGSNAAFGSGAVRSDRRLFRTYPPLRERSDGPETMIAADVWRTKDTVPGILFTPPQGAIVRLDYRFSGAHTSATGICRLAPQLSGGNVYTPDTPDAAVSEGVGLHTATAFVILGPMTAEPTTFDVAFQTNQGNPDTATFRNIYRSIEIIPRS